LRQYVGTLTVPAPPQRAGLPAATSIFGHDTLMTSSGQQYRILASTELDPYDASTPAIAPNARTALLERPAPGGDDYQGTARKAAKLSIAQANMETFTDVAALIATLPSDDDMAAQQISTDASSDRVAVENRNVHVSAFLYAASQEADNDYHLIVGVDPSSASPTYMTAEVSGLPPTSAPSFAQLQTVRETYKQFFSDKLPLASYDFYDPPIPITLEGSLFWDATHAAGGHPGPSSLRPNMPVIWEIHPITSIAFEPATGNGPSPSNGQSPGN
jgi:hypothetical protein